MHWTKQNPFYEVGYAVKEGRTSNHRDSLRSCIQNFPCHPSPFVCRRTRLGMVWESEACVEVNDNYVCCVRSRVVPIRIVGEQYELIVTIRSSKLKRNWS